MRIRLAIGAALAGLLALGAVGAGGAGAAAPNGVLKGETAQKRGIALAVRGDAMRVLRFKVVLRCQDGTILVLDESGFRPTPLRKRNRFADVQVGRTDVVRFRGRVFPRLVRGQVRVSDRLRRGGPRCFSPWIGFVARPLRRGQATAAGGVG